MTIYEQDDWYEWMEDNDLAAGADLLNAIRAEVGSDQEFLEVCNELGIDPENGLPVKDF